MPTAELPLTVQLVSVVVPSFVVQAAAVAGGVAADGAVGQRGLAVGSVYRPPPLVAELPLTVQSVSVAVPSKLSRPPPLVAELPLTVHLVSVSRAALVIEAAACGGGVAADGAVGQRDRAAIVVQAAAFGGDAPRHGQPRERRRSPMQVEHPRCIVAADRQQVRSGALDRERCPWPS